MLFLKEAKHAEGTDTPHTRLKD